MARSPGPKAVPLAALILTLIAVRPLAAQTEEQAVLDAVQAFFDAMAAGDAEASRRTMLEEGQWFVPSEGPGGMQLARAPHGEYLARLEAGDERLLERMWDPTVLVHGPIAIVWTPYDFHLNGEFSHCGVDAFSLVKTDEGWKISGVIFTRETEGCDSPLGPVDGG